ncbi:hypothetical protein V9K67_07000 [Paraflavisolibacter sp. H34]|uniref:hypothetical protein n=1 Tax=Huijunlia imazamoxiresistens TaxID=3127457 RepID=UPI0030189D7C
MYTQIWNKYLPIIRILLKKALSGEQTLGMNITDFERAGINRKTGSKFNIQFSNGRVTNVVIASAVAKDLAAVLLQDNAVKEIFSRNDYKLSMNTKFQLIITWIPREGQESAQENAGENEHEAAEMEVA